MSRTMTIKGVPVKVLDTKVTNDIQYIRAGAVHKLDPKWTLVCRCGASIGVNKSGDIVGAKNTPQVITEYDYDDNEPYEYTIDSWSCEACDEVVFPRFIATYKEDVPISVGKRGYVKIESPTLLFLEAFCDFSVTYDATLDGVPVKLAPTMVTIEVGGLYTYEFSLLF